MYESYFVVDVETCPIDLDGYFLLETDEEKIKKLNPIDSKIIAIGIRNRGESKIFSGDEKDILTKFWSEWKKLKYGSPSILLVGFNVTNFDIPFIVARLKFRDFIFSDNSDSVISPSPITTTTNGYFFNN